jgi:hypothetical protein
MDGQLPGGHPSQQQYPSPKQGKSTSGTPTGFCAGAVGTATTVWFSAKERRMDCSSPGWLARKAKESTCRGTGSVLSLMGLEGSACCVLVLRSCWTRMALIMSRALSCEMGSWTCEVGLSTVVWMVVSGCVGRESDPMKRTGGLMAFAAIRGLFWTALSMTEAQKATEKTIGMRSDRRRSVRPMIGTIVVNNQVSLEIFELEEGLCSCTDGDRKMV